MASAFRTTWVEALMGRCGTWCRCDLSQCLCCPTHPPGPGAFPPSRRVERCGLQFATFTFLVWQQLPLCLPSPTQGKDGCQGCSIWDPPITPTLKDRMKGTSRVFLCLRQEMGFDEKEKITRTRNRASPFPRLTCQNICCGNDKEIEPWPDSLHEKNLF